MPGQGYKPFQNEEELPQSGQNDTTSKPTNNANTGAMGQPMAGPGQPLMAPGQPVNKSGQPVNISGQPMMATGQPMNVSGQPVNTSGQPMTATGQPMMTPGPPINASGQPVNTSGQPMMATGQPMNAYGQPLMAPGQPINASGQPMMTPGQPILAPGQYGYNLNQSQFPYVVNQQPGMPREMQLMPPPSAVPGCPPGLEYLVQLDQLLVHQQIELAEAGLLSSAVGSELVAGGLLASASVMAVDEGRMVGHEYTGTGKVLGAGLMSFIEPHFDIQNAENQCVLKIRGRSCRCQGVMCTDDIEFKIITKDERTELGKVSKQWGGLLKEMYTQADNFGVQFPADMDVKTKALLLASTFLIDFMFFENPKNNDRQNHQHY
eukprot:XP_011665279.1 PREDICTED: phospholipid scramblase 1-like [Strongylocentrotus purpuratus]